MYQEPEKRDTKSPKTFSFLQGGGRGNYLFVFANIELSNFLGTVVASSESWNWMPTSLWVRLWLNLLDVFILRIKKYWHLSKITTANSQQPTSEKEKSPGRYVAVICICTCFWVHYGITESSHLRARRRFSILLFQPLPLTDGETEAQWKDVNYPASLS